MTPLETSRLLLKEAVASDAPFVLRLLNEPSFLRQIGDKGIRTEDDARRYIDDLRAGYAAHGFGLYVAHRRDPPHPIGICGLVTRPELADPDLGFAFVPESWRQGFAEEAARRVLDDARRRLRLQRLLAVTLPDNEASIALLGKLGFEETDPISFHGAPARLFELSLA